ncbi:MAG: tetratricopeptide repeat protein [Planctomycetota bacterium]|jgi:hypothetical protein
MRSPNSRYRYVNRTSARTDRSRGSAVGRPGTATRGSRTRPAVATPRTGARTARGATTGRRAPVNTARYGYRGRHTHVAPVSHTNYHSHYHSRGYYCSWHFGHGRYYGCRFYSPYYNYCTGRHIAFFYAAPVAWVYVPFGFYDDYEEPVYVTTKDGIDEEYAEEHDPKRYESEEYDPEQYAEETDATAKPENKKSEEQKEVDPEPAADSPTTEKFLREASAAFHGADYDSAAKKFRLAAVSAPENPAPLFALGQALIALGQDDYAARVIRRAVVLSPKLLDEPGDLVGVYKNQEEFDRVIGALSTRSATSGQARFLLGVQRYFTGDPRAVGIFADLAKVDPADSVVARFNGAVKKRFKAASDLPPIK